MLIAHLNNIAQNEHFWGVFHRLPLNAIFDTEHLTDSDIINYAKTISDKVQENELVMKQLNNNSPEQAMLGDFPKAVEDAIMNSSEAHQNQMLQLLSDPAKSANFAKVVFDLLTLARSS